MDSIPLTELQIQIQMDAKIDITKLDKASVEAPYTYSKYLTIHANEKMWLKTYQKQFDVLNIKKTAYYKGDAPEAEYKLNPLHVRVPANQLAIYVAGDSDIQEAQNKLDVQTIKVEMLKEFMKVLYQKTFNIKNAIEYQKFTNGIG